MMGFFKYLKQVKEKNTNGLSFFDHLAIYGEWKNQLKKNSSPLTLKLPWITIVAKNYLQQYLQTKQRASVKVFEYGSGGSSLFFLKYAQEVHSVEHDEGWFNKVNQLIAGQYATEWNGYFKPPANLNSEETEKLDPANPLHYFTQTGNYNFSEYVKQIDRFENDYFDIVLVDGRSRPSCIAHSLSKIKISGLLVLDNAERAYYLSQSKIDPKQFELKLAHYGALIGTPQFTQTNIYQRIQ